MGICLNLSFLRGGSQWQKFHMRGNVGENGSFGTVSKGRIPSGLCSYQEHDKWLALRSLVLLPGGLM